jgi:peptide/nickel transport system ATP-binding protein
MAGELVERLRAENDLAMLFIAHDLAVVRGLADRVGVLFGGQLFEVGAARAVFELPFHPYTHELLMATPGPKSVHAPPRARTWMTPPPRLGCAYAHRCPWKLGPICEQEAPPWRAAAPELKIRCHREIEDLRARAVWRPFAAPKSQTEVANTSATRRPA